MIDWPDITRRNGPAASWSEKTVQDAVYVHCAIKNHEIMVPNSQLFKWESDMVSVTRTGFIHEFEIKVTRADFKQDAKKERARLLLDPVVKGYFQNYPCSRPNYFHYVVPDGLITANEIPEYAGLIYAMKPVVGYRLSYSTISVIKNAVRIHKERIVDAQRRQLERSMAFRYWRFRLRATEAEPSPELSFEPTTEGNHRPASELNG
jgi:hypothetical protein